MTMLRQSAIEKLERVPEDRLEAVIQFINQLIDVSDSREKTWDLDQFVMPPTQRGQDADAYIRELRDHDRL